jgi:hypothetical protein
VLGRHNSAPYSDAVLTQRLSLAQSGLNQARADLVQIGLIGYVRSPYQCRPWTCRGRKRPAWGEPDMVHARVLRLDQIRRENLA